MMRNIIGQTKSAFDLRDIMDNKKILLVNLSKGRTGELNSKLLGMIFVMKFQAAAMSRSDTPEDQRVDFSLYVDEFQNFSTDSFATIMSEARKFRLNLIVANQFTTQLTPEIRDAVFGNMGTIVSFRIGQNDVESLGKYFQPTFDGDDLLRVPNYNSIVRTLIGGVPTQPFSMATLPPLGVPNPRLFDALKQLSAAKYGRPKAVVEKEVFARITTKEDPIPAAPAFGGAKPAANAGAAPPFVAAPAPGQTRAPAAPAPAGSGSFLDEWLAKRRDGTPPPTVGPTTAPAPVAFAPAPVTAAPLPSPTVPTVSSLNEQPKISPATSSQLAPEQAPVAEVAPAASEATIQLRSTTDSEPQETKNISSDSIEQNEVDKIAEQLRQRLDAAVPAVPNEPKPVVPQPPSKPVSRQPQPDTKEDTIFIDSDGSFSQADNIA
jgi:hypothetical protein